MFVQVLFVPQCAPDLAGLQQAGGPIQVGGTCRSARKKAARAQPNWSQDTQGVRVRMKHSCCVGRGFASVAAALFCAPQTCLQLQEDAPVQAGNRLQVSRARSAVGFFAQVLRRRVSPPLFPAGFSPPQDASPQAASLHSHASRVCSTSFDTAGWWGLSEAPAMS